MTEDQAKMKWCPFARHGFHRDYAVDMAAQFPCIASACMAWRTTTQFVQSQTADPQPVPLPPSGYCGLAGPLP